MILSAIIAKSSAAHRMLLGASRAQRSPFLNPRATRNLRACSIKASSSPPVTDTMLPSRTSPSTWALAACSSRLKMFSRNVIAGSDSRRHCFATLFHQAAKLRAERRQIVFPAEHSLPHWKFSEVTRHQFFEIDAHARHELQVASYGMRNGFADFIGLRIERLERNYNFVRQIRFIHTHQQMFVPPFAHQVANPLIHRYSCRRDSRRHRSDDRVVA